MATSNVLMSYASPRCRHARPGDGGWDKHREDAYFQLTAYSAFQCVARVKLGFLEGDRLCLKICRLPIRHCSVGWGRPACVACEPCAPRFGFRQPEAFSFARPGRVLHIYQYKLLGQTICDDRFKWKATCSNHVSSRHLVLLPFIIKLSLSISSMMENDSAVAIFQSNKFNLSNRITIRQVRFWRRNKIFACVYA